MMITWAEVPGVYAIPEKGVVCTSDHVNARLEDNRLVIDNPTLYPARVKVMTDSADTLAEPLGLYWQEKMTCVSVEAGGSASVAL